MDTVDVHFGGPHRTQGRRGPVLARIKGGKDKEDEAMGLLQKLCRMLDGRPDLPLRAYRGYGGW